MFGAGLTYYPPVLGECCVVCLVPNLLEQLGRALHVGEEEGDGAYRARATRRTIIRREKSRVQFIPQLWIEDRLLRERAGMSLDAASGLASRESDGGESMRAIEPSQPRGRDSPGTQSMARKGRAIVAIETRC
jgi:hypothetical protein